MLGLKKLKNSNNEYSKKMEKFLKEYNKCKKRKKLDITNYIEHILKKHKKRLEEKYKKQCNKQYSKQSTGIIDKIQGELLSTYGYLINFEECFKMFYDEDSKLFKKNGETNNEIVDAIFKYIYLDITIDDKELLSELKLSENFFDEIKKYDFKPIEIEFLNAILTHYYPGNEKEIKEWYNGQQNKELTYVEKTFLLQIDSYGNKQFIPMNFFNNEANKTFTFDNKTFVFKDMLNIHFQSGCHNDFFDNEECLVDTSEKPLSKLAKFVCYTINKGNNEVKEQIVYRIFELLGGREYFITKKEKEIDKYRLFKLRGSGIYIDNSFFNFTNIVRDGNKYASLFGYIFNILQKDSNNIFNILNAFNNMLNKKEVEYMDKASMLLPLFIENNTTNNMSDKKEVENKDKKTYKTLFDELVGKYSSENKFKEIFKNIYEKAKEYLPDDYLSKSSYYKEILETKELKNNTVAKLSDENVKTEEEQDNQLIFKTENDSSQELELQYSDLSDKSSNEGEKIEEQSQNQNELLNGDKKTEKQPENQNKLSNENLKTKGKTGNDYSSELPDSTVSKEKEKTKNNNSSQESKLLSKDKETEKESQNQNKSSNENVKTKEEQNNQTTIAIENYSSKELEFPHSSLLDKSSNKGEKIEEQPEIKNEYQKIIRWKSGKIFGQYTKVIEEVSRNKTENKQSDNNNELLEKLKKRKKIVDREIEQNIMPSTLSVQTQPYVTMKEEIKSNEKIPDVEDIHTKLTEQEKKFKGNSK